MYICIDKKREVRLKRIFHSFTVVGVFKVFCEKRFLVCSTSTGMYIEAPLDYPINCSGLFIFRNLFDIRIPFRKSAKLHRNKSAE